MNAYLALTKLNGSARESELKRAILQKDQKRALYSDVIQKYNGIWEQDSQKEWYSHTFEQYYKGLEALGSESYNCTLVSISPLTLGQGQPSVLETHLTLHPIYGVPYLPGTAIKGTAAHYCHSYLGKQDEDFLLGGSYYNLLFGTTDQAGKIHYYDALVTPEKVSGSLELDVLTPHHQAYNQIVVGQGSAGAESAPHDDDSPVPVHFLNIRGDFKLHLSYQGLGEQARKWLEIAAEIVTAAVGQEGLGGKSNAGYGRLRSDEIRG